MPAAAARAPTPTTAPWVDTCARPARWNRGTPPGRPPRRYRNTLPPGTHGARGLDGMTRPRGGAGRGQTTERNDWRLRAMRRREPPDERPEQPQRVDKSVRDYLDMTKPRR